MPPKKAEKKPAVEAGPTAEAEQAVARARFHLTELENANAVLKYSVSTSVDAAADARAAAERAALDMAAMSSYAAREVSARDAELRKVHADAAAAAAAHSAELVAERAAAARAADLLAREEAEVKAGLREALREAQYRLERAGQWAEQKDEVERQHESQRTELEAQVAKLAHDLREQEHRFIADKGRAARELEGLQASMRDAARVAVLRELSDEQRRMFADAKVMAQELRSSAEATAASTREISALSVERTALAREVAVLRDAERGWATRCAAHAAEVKALRARVAAADAAAAEEGRSRRAEVATLLARFERESEGARAEAAGLHALVALKNRELRTLKRLASIVLAQRTDVEQFFLEALGAVRMDIIAQRKAAARGAGGGGSGASGIVGGGEAPVARSSTAGSGVAAALAARRKGPDDAGAEGGDTSLAASKLPRSQSPAGGSEPRPRSLSPTRSAAPSSGSDVAAGTLHHDAPADAAAAVTVSVAASAAAFHPRFVAPQPAPTLRLRGRAIAGASSVAALQVSVPRDAPPVPPPAAAVTLSDLARAAPPIPRGGRAAATSILSGGGSGSGGATQHRVAVAATAAVEFAAVGSTVKLEELSLEDRERVLRLLFARINGSASSSTATLGGMGRTTAASAAAAMGGVGDGGEDDEDVLGLGLGGAAAEELGAATEPLGRDGAEASPPRDSRPSSQARIRVAQPFGLVASLPPEAWSPG